MRSFIALDVDSALKKSIIDAGTIFKNSVFGKFIPQEQIHSTLFFFENFKEDVVQFKKSFLDINFDPFEIEIKGFDYFTFQKRPSILYLKYHSEKLLDHYYRIKSILDQMCVVYDKKPFKEHITICRIKEVKDLDLFHKDIIEQNAKFSNFKSIVREISFYESRLTPNGPIYTKLFSLGGSNNEDKNY